MPLFSLLRAPIEDIERRWNDNTRASLSAGLVTIEMWVYLPWYMVCFYYNFMGNDVPQGMHEAFGKDILSHVVLMPMLGMTLFMLVYAGVMNRVFLRVKAKTRLWYSLQAIYVLLYFCFCTIFAQIFGENTIIVGLNLAGGIILGLLLLERSLVLWAFLLSILSFILISLNRKLHWIDLGFFAASSAQDYWFWILTYLYFTVSKVTITVVGVDWILKILGKQKSKIYELSQRDALTQLYNRRTLYGYLNYIWQGHLPCDCVSVVFFDLDKFKVINDEQGHATGDKTLVEICKVVNHYLKQASIDSCFGRLGGEEFVIVLPNFSTQQALAVAEQLRHIIKTHPIVGKNLEQPFFVTASFGVATLLDPISLPARDKTTTYYHFEDYIKDCLQISPELSTAMQDLINMASNGTRTAKQQGRDRVVIGGFTMPTGEQTVQAV